LSRSSRTQNKDNLVNGSRSSRRRRKKKLKKKMEDLSSMNVWTAVPFCSAGQGKVNVTESETGKSQNHLEEKKNDAIASEELQRNFLKPPPGFPGV